MDPDELDRYMSGQPAREPRFDPYGRSQSSGRTERTQAASQQPRRRPQPAQPQYDDIDGYEYDDVAPRQADQWIDDDYGYDDDLAYDEYEPEPAPPQPRRQQRPPVHQRPSEFEYEEDLYDDPYVLDEVEEEEPLRRPKRRPQRRGRSGRSGRQSPGFALPPALADAPLMKDQTALMLLGVAVVSLLAMLIVVTTQRSELGEVIFTHVNANGEPANLQTSDAIWNLPLIAGMVTLISGVVAWFLARWGEFLPRFLFGGAIAIHFVVWVAVIGYLF